MIRADKGEVKFEGTREMILAEATTIMKSVINEFGKDDAVHVMVLAIVTQDEDYKRVDMTEFRNALDKLKGEE